MAMGDAAKKLNENNKVLSLFQKHEHFAKAMLDAFVVVDRFGKVLKSNQLFSVLTGLKCRQILKIDSLDEILSFFINGRAIPVGEILKYRSPTRIDEVRGQTDTKADLNLILGIYPFIDGGMIHGAFILVRDVTAETALQGKYKVKATESITDPLTGLFNRGYLNSYLPMHIETMMKYPSDAKQRNICLVMIDIDHFKKCNDTYGHLAGDEVIQYVASVLKNKLRKTDMVYRYGGEEFLAILPASDLEGAKVAAEKVRREVENSIVEFEGTKITTTVSIGVAKIELGRENATDTIARADAALYHSKDNGRNRVSIHLGNDAIEQI
ncbi:MAG: GGDEF domain-containing protein [Bdellovibrionota bacterium]